jgi:hypothetical protein
MMKRKIAFDVLYLHGNIVYLRVETMDKIPGVVVGYEIRNNALSYLVSWGSGKPTKHAEVELTDTFIPDFGEKDDED